MDHHVPVSRATNRVAFSVTIKDNVSFIFNELAGIVVAPEGLENRLIGENVMVTDEIL